MPNDAIRESLPPTAQVCSDFAARYPTYAHTAALDRLRSSEYRRLDERGHVYLDYTGGSLYGAPTFLAIRIPQIQPPQP
jgi:hypothetical protein